jgi:hypothetical protein
MSTFDLDDCFDEVVASSTTKAAAVVAASTSVANDDEPEVDLSQKSSSIVESEGVMEIGDDGELKPEPVLPVKKSGASKYAAARYVTDHKAA